MCLTVLLKYMDLQGNVRMHYCLEQAVPRCLAQQCGSAGQCQDGSGGLGRCCRILREGVQASAQLLLCCCQPGACAVPAGQDKGIDKDHEVSSLKHTRKAPFPSRHTSKQYLTSVLAGRCCGGIQTSRTCGQHLQQQVGGKGILMRRKTTGRELRIHDTKTRSGCSSGGGGRPSYGPTWKRSWR